MTEHLPECPVAVARPGTFTSCICEPLRSCEQRVFALHPEWTVTGLCKPDCAACRRLTELITEWEYGYKKGLDAAREAVAALDHAPRCELVWGCECSESHPLECTCNRDDALSAIDALKEKP